MASFTLSRGDVFPDGTTVGAYPQSNWTYSQLPPTGAAPGSTSASGSVSGGSVTFTGLADSTPYFAGASVNSVWRYVAFTTPAAASGTGGAETDPIASAALTTHVANTTDAHDLVTRLALKNDKASNLSDVANASTARTNLGLGSAATQASTAFAAASHTHPATDLTGSPAGDVNGTGTTWAAPLIGDLKVSPRKQSDLARTGGWLPTNAIDQTVPDRLIGTGSVALTSGQLYVGGGVVLPGGRAVSSITFMSGGTAVATPTNQWFCIVDKATLAVLATTVDDTSAAWSTNTMKTLNIATTIGGSVAGSYTPTNNVEVYVGVCVVAVTAPALRGFTNTGTATNLAPVLSGTSTGSLTTPASAPATIAAVTGNATLPYAYVS